MNLFLFEVILDLTFGGFIVLLLRHTPKVLL